MEFGYIVWTQCYNLGLETYNSLNFIRVEIFKVV